MARRRRGRDREAARLALPAAASARGWSRSSGCGRSTPWSSAGGPGKEEGTVGSLILGLYDDDGELRVVGHTSGLKAKEKRELVDDAGPVRDRRARLGRPEPLGGRPRPRVGRPAPRARGRGQLRPRQRRPHPPRLEDPALARRQGRRPSAGSSSSTRRPEASAGLRRGPPLRAPLGRLPALGDVDRRASDLVAAKLEDAHRRRSPRRLVGSSIEHLARSRDRPRPLIVAELARRRRGAQLLRQSRRSSTPIEAPLTAETSSAASIVVRSRARSRDR